MSSYQAVLIPGDGIGPEVSEAACRVIEAAGVDIHWQVFQAGVQAEEAGQASLPQELVETARAIGVILKGPLTTPVGTGFSSVNVRLRRSLEMYANLRPIRSLPLVGSRYDQVDLVVIRENTEGLYIGEEHWEDENTVIAARRITRSGSHRISRFAFEYAQAQGRQSVTAVHKANILKESDGLFLMEAQQVSKDYPEIAFQDRIVDALCLDLVVDPGLHSTLLCPNLYGDIISDLAAGLVGGLGVIPGANLGEHCAMFEAVHGSAPDLAGQGTANPTALILAGALLLRHLGEEKAAGKVEEGIRTLYAAREHLTPDIGGSASTNGFTEALINQIT